MLCPEHLAAAEEADVKKALAVGLPAAVKKTKQDKSVLLTPLVCLLAFGLQERFSFRSNKQLSRMPT